MKKNGLPLPLPNLFNKQSLRACFGSAILKIAFLKIMVLKLLLFKIVHAFGKTR
jgi:hypothetical protein